MLKKISWVHVFVIEAKKAKFIACRIEQAITVDDAGRSAFQFLLVRLGFKGVIIFASWASS